VWTDGHNIRSYSVRNIGSSYQYSITEYDQKGKRKNIQKAGFKSEQEAKEAAEAVIEAMYENATALLKRIK